MTMKPKVHCMKVEGAIEIPRTHIIHCINVEVAGKTTPAWLLADDFCLVRLLVNIHGVLDHPIPIGIYHRGVAQGG